MERDTAAPFDRADARRFLDGALASAASETGAVGLGTEIHFGDDAVIGGALVWDGAVVHLAAFGPAAAAGR